MHAIVITTLGEARDIEPSDDEGPHAEIPPRPQRRPDRAVYHRETFPWIHGNGASEGLPSNLPAWTLACAWHGLTLDYELFGHTVVTGRTPDGDTQALSAHLADQARIATTTMETLQR